MNPDSSKCVAAAPALSSLALTKISGPCLLPAPRHFFQDFFRTEAASGLVLLAAALVAMAAANSSWAPAYEAFWQTRLVVGPEAHPLSLTAQQWVNDGLMAVFFLLVGLEIKRELLVGELSTLRQAALPFAAALGGVAVPACFYLALAPAEARGGWAIPTATDIAFALGVLALVAPGAPAGLKVFLAALAIVDDMAAVLVIALFYTAAVHWAALGGAAVALAGAGRRQPARRAGTRHLRGPGRGVVVLRPRVRRARDGGRRDHRLRRPDAHADRRRAVLGRGPEHPRRIRPRRNRRPAGHHQQGPAGGSARARIGERLGDRSRCCGSNTRCTAPAPSW